MEEPLVECPACKGEGIDLDGYLCWKCKGAGQVRLKDNEEINKHT